MSRWIIQLGELPVMSLNDRNHWSVRQRDTRTIRQVSCLMARSGKIPPLDAPTVRLVVSPPDRRRRDEDNYVLVSKAAVDGLVDAGVLDDDSSAHVTHMMPRLIEPEVKGKWQFYLQIEGYQ